MGICGSEVVGLVPLQAILMAAEYYIEKENLFIISEEQKVRLVCFFFIFLFNTPFRK